MRRLELADLMLLSTVTLWALNFTVAKYVLDRGFQPIAYGSLRFALATLVLCALAYARERSLAMSRRDLAILAGAALVGICINQLTFVYAIKLTTATTVALLFGTLPVMAGLLAHVLGIDRVGTRFWVAALLAFAGAALVALGSGSGLSGHLWGDLLALGATATWACYTVAVAPLLRRYSPLRVSAVGFAIGSVPLLFIGAPQLSTQDFGFPPSIWLLFAYSALGALVVANLLWFGGISRVGPSHASLFANLQPFLAAIFALVILSEPVSGLQIAGGLVIACGIVLARRSPDPAVPARGAVGTVEE